MDRSLRIDKGLTQPDGTTSSTLICIRNKRWISNQITVKRQPVKCIQGRVCTGIHLTQSIGVVFSCRFTHARVNQERRSRCGAMTSQNNPLVTPWLVRQGSSTLVAVSGPWEIDGGVSGCTSREMGIRVMPVTMPVSRLPLTNSV